MSTRGRLLRTRRARGVFTLIAVVLSLGILLRDGGDARAHEYCALCAQTCRNTLESGCEVKYPNPGVHTKASCLSGGYKCNMTYTTSCYTLKKVCSSTSCSGNDCVEDVCTTDPIWAIDGSTTFTGNDKCR